MKPVKEDSCKRLDVSDKPTHRVISRASQEGDGRIFLIKLIVKILPFTKARQVTRRKNCLPTGY